MKKGKTNIWLQPGKICIASGNSVARNLMFERKKDHKLFFTLWDKYLGKMTEVMNYHLTPDGWTVLFKTKAAEEITRAYIDQRIKSKKAKKMHTLKEPKRMLSEHIRMFLSQYVRRLNARLGRKGGLVMSRFRKYVIQSHVDYQHIFELLSQQIRLPSQHLKKYQADEQDYDVLGELRKDSVWVVGSRYYEGVKGIERVLGCLRVLPPKSSVLRKFFTNQKIATNTS